MSFYESLGFLVLGSRLRRLSETFLSDVNMVNSPVIARERGVAVSETRRDRQGIYEGYVKLNAALADGSTRRAAGTVFSDGRPRLIQAREVNLDAEFTSHMLYVINEDRPGFIGQLGTLLGHANINIGSFALGRSAPGGEAIALVEVDGQVPDMVMAELRALPLVRLAKALLF